MTTYDNAAVLFLRNMKKDELSPTTIENYTAAIRYFRESMEKNGYDEPCPEAVLAFKLEREVSLRTINQYLIYLRAFADFGAQNHFWEAPWVPDSAFPPTKKLSAEKSRPYDHILSEGDILQLITAERPVAGRRPRTWLREKAEITLALQSGLRNTEIRSLVPADLEWGTGCIHARVCKGGRARTVPFPPTSRAAIKAYLDSGLRPATAGAYDPLFGTVSRTSGEWKPLGREQFSALIFAYTKAVLGEEKACRSHAMRHGFASIAISSNIPMTILSETLGHQSENTTKIYAKRLNPDEAAQNIGADMERALLHVV